jgi:hypothetical protein
MKHDNGVTIKFVRKWREKSIKDILKMRQSFSENPSKC